MGIFRGRKPPPVINRLDNSQQIANKLAPINYASIVDQLSGNKLDIIRGGDGKVGLAFSSNRGNRIDLESPINVPSVNIPAVNRIKGRAIDEKATEVVLLSQAMTHLGNVIEQMEKTDPNLIEQNRGLITSYYAAVQQGLNRGFDFRTQAIDQRLAKMGLLGGSTEFAMKVALAREKAYAQAELELNTANLAQGLKQQAIANVQQRGQLLATQAGIELNRYGVETQNQLEMRGQDMQADYANQQLEQNKAALDLQQNQQRINTELAHRQLIADDRARMLQVGTALFNQGNEQAIGAKAIDNQQLGALNSAQFARYGVMRNPWEEAGANAMGSILGNLGQAAISKYMPGANQQGGSGSNLKQFAAEQGGRMIGTASAGPVGGEIGAHIGQFVGQKFFSQRK